MKTCIIFAALVAISFAKNIEDKKEIEDLEAVASVELLRTDRADKEVLDTAESNNYVAPSQRPPRPWSPQNYIPDSQNYNPANFQNYLSGNPQNYVTNVENFVTANPQQYIPSNVQNYIPNNPQAPWSNPQNFIPQGPSGQAINNYFPTQFPTSGNYFPSFPQNDNPVEESKPIVPPGSAKPISGNVPTISPNPAPQNPQAPQNDYYVPQNTWTTTQTVPVIKNEQFFGQNGDYKYEYQIADGTHVSEEGYLTNPNTENENVVKKGWYSFTGADGRVYTVTWWADNTGFHAFGDHLPKAPAVPPAIQAALDQAAEEEKKKPTQPPTYYPQPQPTQPTYYPTQNYPQQNYPQQNYPPQNYPQQNYPNQQQTNYQPSYGK